MGENTKESISMIKNMDLGHSNGLMVRRREIKKKKNERKTFTSELSLYYYDFEFIENRERLQG